MQGKHAGMLFKSKLSGAGGIAQWFSVCLAGTRSWVQSSVPQGGKPVSFTFSNSFEENLQEKKNSTKTEMLFNLLILQKCKVNP